MTRKFIDYREFPATQIAPSQIMADSAFELVAAAAKHAVAHHHEDTAELREGINRLVREGVPPEHGGG